MSPVETVSGPARGLTAFSEPYVLMAAEWWPYKVNGVPVFEVLSGNCRCKPIASEARMGDLPPPRVVPSRPFFNCWVDYAGPLTVREGKRRNARNTKAYVSVFVCLATKAIHLELVSDLTTEAFLAALKRFISRRGKPLAMYSDNGTNFKGASQQLTELHAFCNANERREEIKRFCCDSEMSWHFIPPGASHFGGLWEAAIKSAKHHLHRIVGNAHLTFEELQTVLCEIEAILNSRPLTPLSSDPNDLTYITPGHFLIGDALNGVEQLQQHFWNWWSREYLNNLQQRHKWKENKGEQLSIGRMVLVGRSAILPMQWILGRVSETHPGTDSVVRSATIITSKGSIIRPLSRLAILSLEEDK
ncbi:uncharacterized protein LOC105834777 [Monomorium pharaonis]|uniref:uncharacterized protein LOC105834777 n=1 Tax=Monomorium pharaonis TaxID=307658 RepID=UPI001746C8A2|nr:uncharacterized protein LOC105834777 [Monomorium pharaonis]